MTPLLRFAPPLALSICAASLLLSSAHAQAPVATPSAVKTSFDEVTARLDRGGSFYLYLSTEQWLDGLSKTVSEYRDLAAPSAKDPAERKKLEQAFDLASTLVKKSGLEAISGVGASSLAIEPSVVRNTFFIHHYRGKDLGFLGSACGTAPHPLAALDFLPADTAIASYCDLDLPALLIGVGDALEKSGVPEMKKAITDIQKQFAQIAGMPLESALQSLGSAEGLVVTLDPAHPIEIGSNADKETIPAPRAALVIQTKDDRIFKRIDAVVGGFPGLIKTDEGALRMRTMVYPALPTLSLRVTVAQNEQFLMIASDDSLIRDILAAQKSGQGFKINPEFAKLAAGMPAEGNGFSVITRLFVDTLRKVQEDMVKNQPGVPAGQAALMRKFSDAQGIEASYSVSSHVENGWLTISKSERDAK